MNMLTWIVTLIIVYLPHYLTYFIRRHYLDSTVDFNPAPPLILILCGILYPLARIIPEPNITNESATLAQHFIGGGFVSTFYFYYIRKELGLKLPFILQAILVYVVVSSLGVANELLEFISTKLHVYEVDGADVWWDLTANTLGAFSLFFFIESILRFRRYITKA